MQLAEFFMWLNPKCNKYNYYATKFAFLVLLLQPLSVVLGAYYYNKLMLDRRLYTMIIIFYSIIFLLMLYYLLTFEGKMCSLAIDGCKNPHLEWGFNEFLKTVPSNLKKIFWILYFGMFIFFLFWKPIKIGLIYGGLYIFLFVIAHILASKKGPGQWKSFWCFTVNIIPILAIVIGYYFHDNKEIINN